MASAKSPQTSLPKILVTYKVNAKLKTVPNILMTKKDSAFETTSALSSSKYFFKIFIKRNLLID
jgi:hypothetical protein